MWRRLLRLELPLDARKRLFFGVAQGDHAMPRLPFRVQFGASGDYKLWAADGWHHDANDREHTWANHLAKLRVMLEFTNTDLLLEVDVIPLTVRGVNQELFVFMNGAFVAYWPVAQSGIKKARIESSLLGARESVIALLMPNALCPRDVGVSNDERTLGLAFRSLSISAIE